MSHDSEDEAIEEILTSRKKADDSKESKKSSNIEWETNEAGDPDSEW